MMSSPLTAGRRGFGALNLYADRTTVYNRYVRAMATSIAAQVFS